MFHHFGKERSDIPGVIISTVMGPLKGQARDL